MIRIRRREASTSPSFIAGGRFCGFARANRGQSMAEFAMVLPVILIILLGLVEFANAYDTVHGLAGISREGANIAARGTSFSEVMDVVMADGATLGLNEGGGAVVSRIVVRQGVPVVEEQLASAGYAGTSQLGAKDGAVDVLRTVGFSEGSTHYAVEVYLGYESVTPLKRLLGSAVPEMLYERAIF